MVAADVIYFPGEELALQLVTTLRRLCHSDSVVLLAHEFRGDWVRGPGHAETRRCAGKKGFCTGSAVLELGLSKAPWHSPARSSTCRSITTRLR